MDIRIVSWKQGKFLEVREKNDKEMDCQAPDMAKSPEDRQRDIRQGQEPRRAKAEVCQGTNGFVGSERKRAVSAFSKRR